MVVLRLAHGNDGESAWITRLAHQRLLHPSRRADRFRLPVQPPSAPGSDRDRREGDTAHVPLIVGGRCQHRDMSAPTVDAAINDLMDWAWHAVYKLLSARGLLGDGLAVEEYTGLMSWVEGPTRY